MLRLTAPKSVLLFIVLVGLGIWGWTRFFPPPEKQIERTLQKLAADASFKNEKPLDHLITINAVPSFFILTLLSKSPTALIPPP